jgi:hypothetical protein
MAVDVKKLISANDINNGAITVNPGTKSTARMLDYNPESMKTTPVITDIDDKYDARFDDPTYYN